MKANKCGNNDKIYEYIINVNVEGLYSLLTVMIVSLQARLGELLYSMYCYWSLYYFQGASGIGGKHSYVSVLVYWYMNMYVRWAYDVKHKYL